MVKNLNTTTPETLKLLEERLENTIQGINSSKHFLNVELAVQEIGSATNK